MELCSVLKGQEEGTGKGKKKSSQTVIQPEDEDEEEEEEDEAEEKGAKTPDSGPDMPAEEPRATSAAEKEKSDMTQ